MRELYTVEEVEDLLAEFNSPKNRLTVFKPFVQYFGDLNTAIILSEIFTWSHHYRNRKLSGIGFGWFYRQYEPYSKQINPDINLCAEITANEMDETEGRESAGKTWIERVGLKEDVVRKIVKVLVKDGYVQTTIKKANGAPTCHYKFVRGKLLELMDTLKKQEWKPVNHRERFPKKAGKETCNNRGTLTEETAYITQKTTTEEIRLLLFNTPLFEISDKDLKILIKRHGSNRLFLVADIAAEAWKRDRREIRNPGGYLQTLCESHSVPVWFVPLNVRTAKAEAAAERKRAKEQKQIAQKDAEKQEAQARYDYWTSLTDEDQLKYRNEARESSQLFSDLDGDPLNAIAKQIAWDSRSQINTNTDSAVKPDR